MTDFERYAAGLSGAGFCGVGEPNPTRVYWWDGEYVEVVRGVTRDYHVSKSRTLPFPPLPSEAIERYRKALQDR